MMHPIGNLTAIVSACLLLSSQLQTQARTCRIVYPERPKDAPKMAYLYDGKNNYRIALPSTNLSEVIELPAGDIHLAMTANEIPDPKAIPANIPVLKIPEAVRDFYILVTPDRDNPAFPIRMNLVDAGAGKLNPGQTLWFNMTGHHVVAKLGNSKMSVEPLKRSISGPPLSASGYYVAELAYQMNGEGAYLPITKQQWWHDANSRHLGFVVNTGGKLPRIYFFRDFRLPKHLLEAAEPLDSDDSESSIGEQDPSTDE